MKNCLDQEKLSMGVCYYPEHWDRKIWPDDIARMRKAGITCVRVAEFAWNLMEKKEGEYDFSLWDDFLALCRDTGMKVIFCTPTATPPAWLTEAQPGVLTADADGHPYFHGLRRHASIASPVYRAYSKKITRALAERYGDHPAIVGWQLDNEINCETDLYYAPCDHEAFRGWMKETFGTLDELNDRMGTVFWNQTYTDWGEVYLPRRNVDSDLHGNPHMELMMRRWISRAAIDFMKDQIDILRPQIGERFITTNGLFGHLDYEELLEKGLDFICYDNYPNFAYGIGEADDGLRDRSAVRALAKARAISPVFGIMEQQSGPGGWTFRMLQSSPRPGQMRLWSWQAVACGASYVSYFRWRTAPVGTEIYWHGILDYDGRDTRRLREAEAFHAEEERLNGAVPGFAKSRYRARAGILRDRDNEWDAEVDEWVGRLARASDEGLTRAMTKAHVPYDYVDLRDATEADELMAYDVLFYPHPAILTQKRAETLEEFVRRGGQLVFGARTGYKDEWGRCPMVARPGPVAGLCGCEVEDHTLLGLQDEKVSVRFQNGDAEAILVCDMLRATDGREIAKFAGTWFGGACAAVEKETGKGRAIMIGTAFGEEMAKWLIGYTGMGAIGRGIIQAPEEIELEARGSVLFVLNPQKEEVKVTFEKEVVDILQGRVLKGECVIAPYDVYAIEGR